MLIPEDGTQPGGANTYAGLEESEAWLVPRGLWPVTPAETSEAADMTTRKTAALLRATDWLNALPGGEWKGRPLGVDQTMAWPRAGVMVAGVPVSEGLVPQAVKVACMELAALFFSGKDLLAPRERDGAVVSESCSKTREAGPVKAVTSHSMTYAPGSPGSSGTASDGYFPSVAGLLAPYLRVLPGRSSGGQMIPVGRG